MVKNLLVELFVEELPPKSLKKLGDAFADGIFSGLESRDFLEPASVMTAFASPRRLAVHITDVRAVSQPRLQPSKPLMPVAVGLDSEGKPTAPLLKRLRSMYHDEIDIKWLMKERVFIEDEGGKQVLKHRKGLAAGGPLFIGLEGALVDALEELPIAKVMAYQLHDGWSTVNFVRPAHGLVVLHGREVVPVEKILGLEPGRETQGHRFEASSASLKIRDADSYAQQLETEGAVIASFNARREEILRQITAVAAKEKLTPVGDDDLLNEVTALVERPNVLVGKFEREFLEVPRECLILTMKANQKYFPLLDSKGKLTNKFLIVSNIRPKDASLVIGGNERVVRPRLADAKFFFDQDRKKPLDSRVLGLSRVVYHNKLGSQGDRVQRVQAIARAIARQLGGDPLALQADQAALLAKADLLTDMVGEFPELQGIMGRYYAKHDGLSDDIAFAIEDHYKPRFAGDELPRNMVGVCVALADKLETLLGMFGIGEIPTGDKDPFALRRHALGVIRMLIEKELPLELEGIINIASKIFGDRIFVSGAHPSIKPKGSFAEGSMGVAINSNAAELTSDFIYDRLAGLLKEQGYSAQEVDAVLSLKPQRLSDVTKRLAAVRTFASLPEAASLAAANK
ncbi:MAG: glycine--tRNA ligase subunit beta, partial [Gallionella sp.]